jgi:hypothetical protein
MQSEPHPRGDGDDEDCESERPDHMAVDRGAKILAFGRCAMGQRESQQLGHSHDYVCLNLGGDLAATMSDGNHGRGVISCRFQFSSVSGLDFVAKKSSLTITNIAYHPAPV